MPRPLARSRLEEVSVTDLPSSAIAIDCTNNLTLTSEVSDYLRASLSENSRKAYRADLNHFLAWGGTIPTSCETVARYLAAHAGKHAISTLARRLVSISKAHSTQGMLPPTDSELVRATFRGIRHTHGSAQRQVAPAVKEDVILMVAGLKDLKGIRDKALLLIGFAGAFRRSELVSLTVADIEHAQQGMIVLLRFSKTDQDGRGRKVAIPHARGAACPVLALKHWLATSGITEGPIFRPVSRHGVIAGSALSAQAVAQVVKERAKAVGLDPARYAGHSLRAGLATSAAQAGIAAHKIMAQTGHRSMEMLNRYIRDGELFQNNAGGIL